MRESHKHAPLHRIESWSGSYFRPAALWEVGTYLLVPHFEEDSLCSTLTFQKDFLDSQQSREDDEEQIRLRNIRNNNDFGTAPEPGLEPEMEPEPEIHSNQDDDVNLSWTDEAHADAAFEASLNTWLHSSALDGNIMEENTETDDVEKDIRNVVEYLGPYRDSKVITENGPTYNPRPTSTSTYPGPTPTYPGPTSTPAYPGPTSTSTLPGPDDPPSRPISDGLNNSYVRVIHTNGIHHIGMVTCSCGGHDKIPLDLVASRLLPASFIRIRTIFTTQLMDYFRLCNLELKASAYQFYQLIRRLTFPMGQSEMVNLYDEFRRMSRLWRWMKKLKWAGYGHNNKLDHLNPPAGSLSIFCPTCPQPSINLPDDWKLDKNRFVFRPVFVADGNFKADHVKQKKNDDVWLMDGGGMVPNQKHYSDFLKKAKEIPTVSQFRLSNLADSVIPEPT